MAAVIEYLAGWYLELGVCTRSLNNNDDVQG
uniref:Uncharacterized protein n=1 Tax=Anguilla anguilla TaxID=7936 RepID=A0A0E9RTX9_ANGAN